VNKNLQKVTIVSDGEMLFHVLSNIINNAIKYRSSSNFPEIGIQLKKNRKNVTLVISDNGIGLTKEERQRAFDKFYQASASVEGSGVGLTICRSITEDLGGKIRLESQGKNRGTSVYLSFNL
jgi:signal transduction histidine kinase